MAWLNSDTPFDPDVLTSQVIGIAAKLSKHDSGHHQHKKGQLLFAREGCIRITLAGRLCMLPPNRVAWIPPNTLHRAEMSHVVGYRSVYLDTSLIQSLSEEIVVLTSNALFREVLERIAISDFNTQWDVGSVAGNLLAVCLDEMRSAQRESVFLRLPKDRRLMHFTGEKLPPHLQVFALTVGASEKTISRIFTKETGLSYQQWRQQWRFLKSIELMSDNYNIAMTADALGFASDSAFVTFFKAMSGFTPRTYLSLSIK